MQQNVGPVLMGARFKVGSKTIASGSSAAGVTAWVAPQSVVSTLQSMALGSWVPAFLVNPGVAGLLTSLGGNVSAQWVADTYERGADSQSKDPIK